MAGSLETRREGELVALEQLASGDRLDAVLETLCAVVEHHAEAGRALFLLSREDGLGARVAAAPSFDVALGAGGVAALFDAVAARGALAEVTIDDAPALGRLDPRWHDFASVGVRSLLAFPVVGPDLKLLGVFLLGHAAPGAIPPSSVELLRQYTPLAGIAIRTDQRERALRRSQEAIREAQRIGRFGDLTVDLARRALTCSEETYALYEWPEGSVEPQLEAFIALHGGPAVPALERALRGEGPPRVDLEAVVSLPSGARAHHRFLLSRVVSADAAEKVTGTVHDVSERRRAEEALHQAQRLESLGLLASGIAHDVNNLLAALRVNLGLIDRGLERELPVRPALEAIDQIAVQAGAMIRQMLSYAGRGSAKEEVVVLDALVGEVERLLSAAVPKHVEIELKLDSGGASMLADTVQVRQVVMNLLTNAVDAIGDRKGRVVVSTSIEEIGTNELARRFPGQGMSEGRFFVVEVADTGRGMDSDTVSRIFDPFFTTKATGRGLGLSAVRGILRAHGGGFEIDSVVDRGTRFLVAFPALRSAEA